MALSMISKAEQNKYGKIYYCAPRATEDEVHELERRGEGAVDVMWLPQFDPKNKYNFHINLKWQHIDNRVRSIPLSHILDSHSDFLLHELETETVKNSYTNPQHHGWIVSYIQKWNARQNQQQRSSISPLLCESKIVLESGYLVMLSETEISFAKQYPIAKIIGIRNVSNGFNIQITHQKSENGMIVAVENSVKWIQKSAIKEVLCETSNGDIHFGIYTQQQLFRSTQRAKQYKQHNKSSLERLLQNYFGKKILKKLTDINFKKKKPMHVEQDIMFEDVNNGLIKKLNKHKIGYSKNTKYLKINVTSATELSHIIGPQNIMNETDEYDIFIIYPIEIKFGYDWVFPRLKVDFNVGKGNAKGNLEH